MIGAIKQKLPWWSKIGAKLALSRLPAGYAVWQRLGLFRHGHMDTAQYALGVFRTHVARAQLSGGLAGRTVLELGPGDSIATALIAKAHGARALLIDVGAYAEIDVAAYIKLAEVLREEGLPAPDLNGITSLEDMLAVCEATYLTEGLSSLRGIPDDAVDLVFSQAVLEHVRKYEFLATQKELLRIVGPDGVCSHRVDLRDHLGGGLNNLRVSERIWESEFFAKSGFYTNRIGFDGMIGMFREAGFSVEITAADRWSVLPIARHNMAPEFRDVSTESLCVSGFDVLLRTEGAARKKD